MRDQAKQSAWGRTHGHKSGCCTTRHNGSHEEYLAQRRGYEAVYRQGKPQGAKMKRWRESPGGRAWTEAYVSAGKQREAWKRWYYGNLEISRFKKLVAQEVRRGRTAKAKGTATLEQVAARVAFYGGKCYMCGAPWKHLDHVIPLSRGGSNWPANLRPACARCNLSKHAKKVNLSGLALAG